MSKHGSELLRLWREQNGLTQEQASEHLGFSPEEICFYERRKRKPGDHRRLKMRDVCGIPWEAWL